MLTAFATSDVGQERKINEDYFSISYPNEEIQVFILADGMGGYNGGEIASQMAVNTAKNYIWTNFENAKKSEEELIKLIKGATQCANMLIYEKSHISEELKNMGTTLDICLIYNNKKYISHIGDSRIYIIKENKIEQITKDHSFVQELIDEGTITEEDGAKHLKRNMLLKALGHESFVEPDIIIEEYNKEEIILMCSDGLSNMIEDKEMLKIILENPTDSTKLLVQTANDSGGKDNVTALIIRSY